MTDFTLSNLDRLIADRMKADDPLSYTAKLKAGGQEMAAKKLGEEAVETVIAAMTEDKAALCSEAADLLYHLLVVLNLGGVSMDKVMDELQDRTRQSGLEEKASRSKA